MTAEEKDTVQEEQLLYCAVVVAVQNENLEFMVASSSDAMSSGRATTGNVGDSCRTLLRTLHISNDEDVAAALLSEHTTVEMKGDGGIGRQPIVYIVRAAKIVRSMDDS